MTLPDSDDNLNNNLFEMGFFLATVQQSDQSQLCIMVNITQPQQHQYRWPPLPCQRTLKNMNSTGVATGTSKHSSPYHQQQPSLCRSIISSHQPHCTCDASSIPQSSMTKWSPIPKNVRHSLQPHRQ